MAVTLTFDATLSRVRITATGLAAADVALVERSTDQVRWATVRGGQAWPVTAGAFALPLDDYEFTPDALNYYRVSAVETATMQFVASGAAATAINASVTPAMPAGVLAGDLLIIVASIRNSGAGTVNVPAGWTLMLASGNVSIMGRRMVAGDVSPTVTFSGGVANADTIARMIAFHRADLPPVFTGQQLNASAQNIAYPTAAVTEDNVYVLAVGWKQDAWASVATLATPATVWNEVSETISSAGDDSSQVIDRWKQATATAVPASSFVVTGGISAISRGLVLGLRHAPWLSQQTASITPAQQGVWLKSIARPFLNQAVQAVWKNPGQIARPARLGVFDIVGRSFPVAVSDVRGSRHWAMLVRTETTQDADDLNLLLASGDTILVQAPEVCTALVPGAYVAVGDTVEEWHPLRPLSHLFTLPLTEVAPPGPDVVGAAGTWQTVINTYATWSTELAARATWADLLTLVGDPSEVVVP